MAGSDLIPTRTPTCLHVRSYARTRVRACVHVDSLHACLCAGMRAGGWAGARAGHHVGRQAGRHAGRQAGMQADWQAGMLGVWERGQAEKQARRKNFGVLLERVRFFFAP